MDITTRLSLDHLSGAYVDYTTSFAVENETFVEVSEKIIVIPNTASDSALDFGEVTAPTMVLLSTLGSDEVLQVRINDVAAPLIPITNGMWLITGSLISSIYLTIPGSVDIPLTVKLFQ